MEETGIRWHPKANVAPGRRPTENSSRRKGYRAKWLIRLKELTSKREHLLRSGPTHTSETESSSTHLSQEFDFIK